MGDLLRYAQEHPQVEMVVYDDEAHGWTLPRNRIDFWSRVENFLNRHIGNPGGKENGQGK